MVATDYPALTDLALTRFLLVSTSAFAVLLVFGFRRGRSKLAALLLLLIAVLAVFFPTFDLVRFSLQPDSEWARGLTGSGHDPAFLVRRLHWAALGTICGLAAALLCGLAGRDLWRVR